MNIQSFHYEFKLKMDRVDTMSSTDFNAAEIDWLINEAQLVYINNRINPAKKARGFEGDQKRIDDLSTLVIKYPIQPGITPTLLDAEIYEVDLADLSYPYLHLISAFTNVDLGNDCIKSTPLKFIQHDDYREALRDPFNSPSLDFIPYNFGRSTAGNSSAIFIYTSNLSGTLDKVFVEYIKRPVKVSLGTYQYIDGITYPTTDCELPEHTHSEIVDLACLLAATAIESPEYLQLKTLKMSLTD